MSSSERQRKAVSNVHAKVSRPHRLTFRVSESELARITSYCSRVGLTESAGIRGAVLDTMGMTTARSDQVTASVVASEPVASLVGELDAHKLRVDVGRIGGNVNQIARALNAGDDVSDLSDKLDAIRNELREMNSRLGGSSQ